MQSYYNYLKQPQMLRKNKFLNAQEGLVYGNIEPATYVPYKDYKSASLKPRNEQEAKMFDLMAVWFAVNEMNLYLDTHPNDAEALELLTENIKKYDDIINILKKEDVLDSIRLRVKKAYPAYFDSYSDFDKVQKYLDKFENLYCIGRNGQHRYNNLDHSMLTGIEVVKIVKGESNKDALWSINAEKEYHETK